MRRGILFALGLAWTLSAQDYRSFQPNQWDGNNLVVFESRQAGEPELAQILDPKGKVIRVVPRCPKPPAPSVIGGSPVFAEGSFFYVFHYASTTPEGKRIMNEVHRYRDNAWAKEAVFPARGTVHLFPLDGSDRYLAISISPKALVKDGKSYPFAVLRRGADGRLDLDQVMDAGLEKPFFSPKGEYNYPVLQMDIMSVDMARTGSHYIMASSYGLFWAFDLRNGGIKRVFRVHDGLTEARLKEGKLMQGLLGFAPTRDGDVLVTLRSEEAILEAYKQMGDPNAFANLAEGGGSPERIAKAWNQHRDLLTRVFPDIEWWRIDPVAGKVISVSPPDHFPNRTSSVKAADDFNWSFKPDGNLMLRTRKESESLGTGPWD